MNCMSKMHFFYRSIYSITLFFAQRYFSLYKIQSFQTGCSWFVFPLCVMQVIPNRLPLMFSFPTISVTLLNEVRKFLAPVLLTILYSPNNKQFSYDSFLDWEGHHWDYRLSRSSLAISSFHHTPYLLFY